MRRMAWVRAALAGALAFAAAPASAHTQTYFGFQIGITNAPPPYVVFYDEPVITRIDGCPVYVIEDCPYDMYRYGSSWYLCEDDYWYRSSSCDGPFRACDVRYVPRTVLNVTVTYRSHGYHRRSWDLDRGYDRGWSDQGWRDRDWRGRDGRYGRFAAVRYRDRDYGSDRGWRDGGGRNRDRQGRGDDGGWRGRGEGRGKHKRGHHDND